MEVKFLAEKGGIGASVNLSAGSVSSFWQDLLRRNEIARARDGDYYEVSNHDRRCPKCSSHPVHQTLEYGKKVWRVCRKCGFYFSKK